MIDFQYIYKLIVVVLYSYFPTLWLGERLIPKFKKLGYTVKDIYKKGTPQVASMGGIIIFSGVLISLTITQVLFSQISFEGFSTSLLLIFYFVVVVYGVFGILDDLIEMGHIWKIIAPFFMALPIGLLVQDTVIRSFGLNLELGWIFPLIIAPLYIMVITNLVNMHAGFNGLASGVSLIIMFFLGLRTVMLGNYQQLVYLLPAFGALAAFYHFDKYPARMLWKNSGSYLIGGVIGGYIILTSQEFFGVILFIPHIVDFLLYAYLKVTGKKFVKFGKLRADGTIQAPNPIKLKFLFPYYFRMTEKQAVYVQYAISIVVGIIALIVS